MSFSYNAGTFYEITEKGSPVRIYLLPYMECVIADEDLAVLPEGNMFHTLENLPSVGLLQVQNERGVVMYMLIRIAERMDVVNTGCILRGQKIGKTRGISHGTVVFKSQQLVMYCYGTDVFTAVAATTSAHVANILEEQ